MFNYRRIRSDEATRFRQLRIAALSHSPEAFGQSLDDALAASLDQYELRVIRSSSGDTHVLYVAEDNNEEWVGMAGCYVKDGAAELVSMWVAPAARRGGHGRKLVEHVVSWAASIGLERVNLYVTETNDEARNFYASLGFKETGDIEPHGWNPELRELLMTSTVVDFLASVEADPNP